MAVSRLEGPHANEELVGSGGNWSKGSSWALKRMEREQRREQDLKQEGHETCLESDEAFSQGKRTILYVPSLHTIVIVTGR